MELILFGLLFIFGGSSMFFAMDFWWESQGFINRSRGLVSERTEEWENWTIFRGFILVGLGFILFCLGIVEQQARSRAVIPLVCPEPNTNLAVKSEIERYVKIACAAAQKKDYQIALTNFKQALNTSDRLDRIKRMQKSPDAIGSALRYAIAQMEKQLKN